MIRPLIRTATRIALRALPLAIVAVVVSCGEAPTGPRGNDVALSGANPASLAGPAVRISEIHYDNTGTDAGEAIEVSGPAGTSLTGWSLVLYNGSGGAVYTPTMALSGTIPATCGTRGVVVVNYPVNGIQNGSPDGVALVNDVGAVVEFLSYEGPFAATNGVASGMTAVDIGTFENGSEPVGRSLQRNGSGTWSAPIASTFGACNDADAPPPPAPVASVAVTPNPASVVIGATQQFTAVGRDAANNVVATIFTWSTADATVATVNATGLATGVAAGTVAIRATSANGIVGSAQITVNPAPPPSATNVHIVEIHYDNDGADTGEQVELFGPAGSSITGWSLALYNFTSGAVYSTIPLTGVFPTTCGTDGVIVVPTPAIQNGSNDGIALVNNSGAVVEFLSYEGVLTATSGPATGMTSVDIGVAESENASPTRSLQRAGDGTWYGPATSSFGVCNPATKPVFPNGIGFSGRNSSDPALPVGYEDQLFATLRDGMSGATIPSTFTWVAETPLIATIDANGVMHAVSAGAATFRATAADGTTGTWTLQMAVPLASTTALYGNNTEFGDPVDGDASDDFIIRRPQFASSYSRTRNTPNWVAYNLEASHFGTEVDRCDCFTADPFLPGSFLHINTNDYTGSGAFAGYGIDRGHLARSFDRTSGALDNATTYLLSNIVPQAADMNQGPWAILENQLGDSARFGGREVYIVAGVAGNKGTLKGEGKVIIPTATWKVAIIMPHDAGLTDVHSYQDLTVIAVIMPNDPGVRNVDWQTYITTVDAVEALSGYDLLSLLPDKIERAVESNTKPPVALLDGPYAGAEGATFAMSGAASVDYNGSVTSYGWTFGDGSVASGANVSHTYVQDGNYTVRLIVTDNDGLADTTTTTASVTNVVPSIAPIAGATLFPGETYNASSSFTDPGADSWSATVDYGDGSGVQGLPLAGQGFVLSHLYAAAGTFTVTVRVSDDDATSVRSAVVTVTTAAAGLDEVAAFVNGLTGSGALSNGNANSLLAKVNAAASQLAKGNTTPALNQLNALLNEIDAMESSGRLTAADASALRLLVTRIRASLGS